MTDLHLPYFPPARVAFFSNETSHDTDNFAPADRDRAGVMVGGRVFEAPTLPPPPAWMKDAECRHWQELFDRVYDYPANSAVADAKRVCASCPVIEQCRAFAFAQDDNMYRYGVFGGLSARERGELAERRPYVRASEPELVPA